MAAMGTGLEGSAGEAPKAEEVKKRPLESAMSISEDEKLVTKKIKAEEEPAAPSPTSGLSDEKDGGKLISGRPQ